MEEKPVQVLSKLTGLLLGLKCMKRFFIVIHVLDSVVLPPLHLAIFVDHEATVHRFVTGSHDASLLVWEWNQQKNAVNCVHTCRGHAGSVDCVAVDPTKTKVSILKGHRQFPKLTSYHQ